MAVRRILSGALLVAAVVAVGIAAGSAALAQAGKPPMTVVSFGGAFAKAHMITLVRPFRAKTGRWVTLDDYDGGLEEIRDQVLSTNVKWDVVSLELPDAVRGCDEGLLEPIDPSILAPAPNGTPATQDFYPQAIQKCAVGHDIWATIVAYNPTLFSDGAPSTLADFFDLGRFPGPRAMRRGPEVNLEWALLVDGVPPEQVYGVLSTAEGLDRAFAVLDQIKTEIVWWTRGSEPERLLQDGTVVMSSAWNGRIFDAVRERGANLEIIWDRQVWNMDTWGIPKGTENLQEALDFVAFATEPRRLADHASLIAYGPARRSSGPLVAEDVKPYLPTAEDRREEAFIIDYEW